MATSARRLARLPWRLPMLAACLMLSAMAPEGGDAQTGRQTATFRLEAEAGRWNGAGLRDLPKGAHLAIEAQADGPATLLLMDEAGMAAFPSGGTPLMASADSERFEFAVSIPEPGDYFLVIDNRAGQGPRVAVVSVTASAPGALSGEDYLRSANQMLAAVNEAMHRVFVLDPFDMRVEACGETRAFADSDDIIVCTEYAMLLLSALPDPSAGSPTMMLSIFQRIADRLSAREGRELSVAEMDDLAAALMVLLQYRDHVETAAGFFAEPERAERFAALMPAESRYRLDADRAMALARAAAEPANLLSRWSDLLIASLTPEMLERILDSNPPWADRNAVRRELDGRRRP